MNNHDTVIVRKPWGYEYLAYKNESVAVWLLNIKSNERTSMHCHPTKSTGLVVVGGRAEINFIADSKVLRAPGKQMIRRGLFHQTYAISEVQMLEIETPVNKDDLVRLQDQYGRKNTGYEDEQYELPKAQDCLWITDPVGDEINYYHIGQSTLKVANAPTLDILKHENCQNIIMFLRGGLTKTINGKKHMVTQPGDVGLVQVVMTVAKEMDGFDPDTVIMIIKGRL